MLTTETQTKAIMDVLDDDLCEANPNAALAAFGVAIGCLALASGEPEEAIGLVLRVARGIINGEAMEFPETKP